MAPAPRRAPSPTPPRSRSPSRPTTPALVRAATEGFVLGGLHLHDLQGLGTEQGPRRDRGAQRPGAQEGRRRRLRGGPGHRRRRSPAPATWSTRRPTTCVPPGFADAVAATVKDRGRGGKVKIEVLDEAQLAELGCGGLLGVGSASDAPPAPGHAHLRAQGRDPPPRPGGQGHHLRLRRPEHQAGRGHARDEVRHGRRGCGHQRDLRDRRPRTARQGHDVRRPGREHAGRRRRCVPAT